MRGALDELGYRGGGGGALDVAAQNGVAFDKARLGHHVERAALCAEDVCHREEFEPRGEAAFRLARPLGDRTKLRTVLGKKGEDKVALPQLRLAHDDDARGIGGTCHKRYFLSDGLLEAMLLSEFHLMVPDFCSAEP